MNSPIKYRRCGNLQFCAIIIVFFEILLSNTVFSKPSSLAPTKTNYQADSTSFAHSRLETTRISVRLLDLTPEELSDEINGNKNNENRRKSDYEISKLLYFAEVNAENFREVWKRFQPDNHVQDNSPFSTAVMDFVSRFLGHELSQWLEYIAIMDERISQYMGLGLYDSQLSGAFTSADQKYILHRILSLGGESDAFSQRRSICQRVSMYGFDLGPYIEKYPSLISCATIRELTVYFKGTRGPFRFEKIQTRLSSFDAVQNDSLVQQLNQPHNFHVEWRTSEFQLAEYDFMEREEIYHRKPVLIGSHECRWGLSSQITQLPTVSRFYKIKPDATWALKLLTSYKISSIDHILKQYDIIYRQEGHLWSAVKDFLRTINNELCGDFTIYQRFLVGSALNQTVKKSSILDMTGWSKQEKKDFSCFLQVSAPGNGIPREHIAVNPSQQAFDKRFQDIEHIVDMGLTFSGQHSTLDLIFEELFYNSSQITTRKSSQTVVNTIRAALKDAYGTEFQSLSQLEEHHFNSIPGFLLREFWTSEFQFNNQILGEKETCRETFIRIGSIDNSDLSALKREKLVQIFLRQCPGTFEDNLRVLNSLVCDYKFQPQELRSEKQRNAWISRARQCEITDAEFAEKVWQEVSFITPSLNSVLFTLGPSNLCSVVPKTYWDSSKTNITSFDSDRLVWTLTKIDDENDRENKECLEIIVKKLRNDTKRPRFWFNTKEMPLCQDFLMLKQLNKYLESDWITKADTNSECVNLIGSNPSWFTHAQLAEYTKMLERVPRVFIGPRIDWKLANLIPYLDQGTLETVLSGIKSETSEREEVLSFLSRLRWPPTENFSNKVEFIFDLFKNSIKLNQRGEIDISKTKNMLCSLPYKTLNSYAQKQEIQSQYFCTKEGQLFKAPIEIPLNRLQQFPLLMDPRFSWIKDVNDLKQLPLELFRNHVEYVIDHNLIKNCSTTQLEVVAQKLSELALTDAKYTSQLQKVKILLDSGEEIFPSKNSGKTENATLIPPSNDTEDVGLTAENALRHSQIVYVILSSSKLQNAFHLIILTFILKLFLLD